MCFFFGGYTLSLSLPIYIYILFYLYIYIYRKLQFLSGGVIGGFAKIAHQQVLFFKAWIFHAWKGDQLRVVGDYWLKLIGNVKLPSHNFGPFISFLFFLGGSVAPAQQKSTSFFWQSWDFNGENAAMKLFNLLDKDSSGEITLEEIDLLSDRSLWNATDGDGWEREDTRGSLKQVISHVWPGTKGRENHGVISCWKLP